MVGAVIAEDRSKRAVPGARYFFVLADADARDVGKVSPARCPANEIPAGASLVSAAVRVDVELVAVDAAVDHTLDAPAQVDIVSRPPHRVSMLRRALRNEARVHPAPPVRQTELGKGHRALVVVVSSRVASDTGALDRLPVQVRSPCSQKRSSQSRGHSERQKPTVSALTGGVVEAMPVPRAAIAVVVVDVGRGDRVRPIPIAAVATPSRSVDGTARHTEKASLSYNHQNVRPRSIHSLRPCQRNATSDVEVCRPAEALRAASGTGWSLK